MKRLFLIFVVFTLGAFAYPSSRAALLQFADSQFASFDGLNSVFKRLKPSEGMERPKEVSLPIPGSSLGKGRTWTFADGTQMDAVLVAADAKSAQLRVLESQGVGQVKLELLAEKDRKRIQSWVQSDGVNGVAGFPVHLKTHRWPHEWRDMGEIPVKRIGETNQWKSQHFEITNKAGVKPEALKAITLICESVDGALSSLPLPLPINWGRDPGELRKIVIEPSPTDENAVTPAGYWDSRTGFVHIFADSLLEPDHQLVVFEFDKPEKVQKYDVIVHEVTHQSMAALLYLGVPAWVTEGIAEYMAATQFAPAYYQFANSHVSIRHHVNKLLLGDRIVKDRKMHHAHLQSLMGRELPEWNRIALSGDFAGFLQYHESLLLVDYFVHRDHPDGVHFRRYLESVLTGVDEEEAREIHLLRGRSYLEIEKEMIDLWKPLGFTINFQDQSELRRDDIAIDWDAEDVKRTIASRRAAEAAMK